MVTGIRVHTFEFTLSTLQVGNRRHFFHVADLKVQFLLTAVCFIIVTTILIPYMWRQGKYFVIIWDWIWLVVVVSITILHYV